MILLSEGNIVIGIDKVLKQGQNNQIDLREDEYLGKDGLPYCKNCNTPRAGFFGEEKRLCRFICKCQSEKIQEQEIQEKLRKEKATIDGIIRNSMLGKNFTHCTFKNMLITENARPVIDKCKSYCKHAEEMLEKGYGIYIYGDAGIGKTYLTACMGNELARLNYRVYFTSFNEITRNLKKNFDDNRAKEDLLCLLENVSFLFLDDVGTENIKNDDSSAWLQTTIYEIINRRYIAKKPIICTSNLKRSELQKPMPGSHQIHTANYEERTVQRLIDMCPLCMELKGDNMRLLHAKKAKGDMDEILRK